MPLAIALIVLAVAYRVTGAHVSGLANFSPLMALAFCGAVYFRSRWMTLVPFAALVVSDLYLNVYYATQYGYTWSSAGFFTRTACFAVAIGLGMLVSRRKNWLTLLGGSVGGSLFFYFATNTVSWLTDPFYARTAAGWWQAMFTGHPQFAPTWMFFRATFVSDVLFTGVFAVAMELAARRTGAASLLGTVDGEPVRVRV